MRSLFICCVACCLVVSGPVTAGLSKQDRDELFQRVDHMCRDASSVGEVITYEGSLDAGATLKVVGINAKGSVTKQQWKNIEQKYGEVRSVPSVCNQEMMKLIIPLFSNIDCRTKANGVDRYQREFDVIRNSTWMGGGFDQAKWCNQVIGQLRGEHPDGEFKVISSSEKSESKCPPFNCPQYMYYCMVNVKADPVYKLSPAGC